MIRNHFTSVDTTRKRNAIILSHSGELSEEVIEEVIEDQDSSEFDTGDHLMFSCLEFRAVSSKCEDTKNNTYRCMRSIDNTENKVVCRFQDDENFLEYYD